MPIPAEKLSHIEDALRRRFFPLVPKRTQNWTEAQHDIDRCSRSFAAYAICGLCAAEDAIGVGSLVDGGNDGGIDALMFAVSEIASSWFSRSSSDLAMLQIRRAPGQIRARPSNSRMG